MAKVEPRETVWKVSGACQTSRHQTNHGCVDERFCAGAKPFVVFAHPPVLAQPREGPLYNPPPRGCYELAQEWLANAGNGRPTVNRNNRGIRIPGAVFQPSS